MTIEIRVPNLPESVADATLVKWHRKAGDAVSRDENLADLETDKVVLEVPVTAGGVLKEILVAEGTIVVAGQVLALLEEGAAVSVAAPAAKLAPAAKRLVDEKQMDPAKIAGSGREGRVSKQDVLKSLEQTSSASVAVATAAVTIATSAVQGPPASQSVPMTLGAAAVNALGAGRNEQRVPMTRLRARIAQRLVEAQSTQALLTTFNEVDLKVLNELRTRYKDKFEKTHDVRLGFMSFFVKAAVEALKKYPIVNAYVDGNDILYHDYYDIGVAVSTERGLFVPVLRDADQLGFADVEKAVGNFAARARAGSITLEELTGGTFTITNGGVFGSLLSTPIVNAPQSAILGMHKIQDRPVVVDGQVVVRPMMYLALTYDHRIIDGKEAVQFLVTMKDCLEDPARLLLQV
jgi:2-oxoglutarate dehydrogenase E2 component (dihydrolipoamide succinyltransferase)